MSKPKPREVDAVSKLSVLDESDVATLYQILGALGFDLGTIALFTEKPEAEVRTLFRLDTSSGRKPPYSSLTGRDLAWWCDLIQLRPGVVQQRLNFDESNLRLKKQGRSSTRVPAGWVGPPLFATKGAVLEGRAFVELAGLLTLPAQSAFSSAVLGQMVAGKYPVRLPQLRDVLAAAEVAALVHQKVDIIKAAIEQFPKGVRTPEDVFEALTYQGAEAIPEEETNKPTEESMRITIIDRFQVEMARRGLLPVLRQLYAESHEIRRFCHEYSIDVGGEILPGPFEMIAGSKAFEFASLKLSTLTGPLRELSGWLVEERQRDALAVREKKTQKPAVVQPPPASRQVAPLLPSKATVIPVPTSPALPVKVVAKLPVEAVVAKPRVSAETLPPVIDEYGVQWDFDRHRVILGAVTIPLLPVSDERLAKKGRTASARVYDTLYAIRNAYALDWPRFCSHLGMERHWFSNLMTSESQLTPMTLKNILTGLQQHYELDLTAAQLFGLAPLALELAETVRTKDVVVAEELLFLLGDARSGYRFASLLAKYRAVLVWFRRVYGVTDEHLERLEKGEIGVPIPVHLVLMWKVRERMESSEGVIIPRAYQWFLTQPHSQPILDRSFILDETAIPCKHWLGQ